MPNSIRTCFITALYSIAALILVSCTSSPKPVGRVDYSDEQSIRYEISKARALLENKPVEALFRSVLLVENSPKMEDIDRLYSDSLDKAVREFDAAVDGERWTEALRVWKSLSTLSIAPAAWDEQRLLASRRRAWRSDGNETLLELDRFEKGTPEDEAPDPDVVSRMIKGTVTVWVDRGLRVQNRIGYADRVIGSGFFIDGRGYLITNYHVISSEVDPSYEGYSRLFIKMPSDPDTRIPARVIGWDPVFDLALLKTEITPPEVFTLGSSQELSVGNRIYAIGSPAGLEQTLTSGIVSAQRRRILSLGDVLQIDAPINHGNSGGPIVDENGRVQAVVFAGIEAFEGLNFAIPVELLKIILPSLYEGGKIMHPWMGAFGRTVSFSGSRQNDGVSPVYIVPGSPLALAGVPANAIITKINNHPVQTLEDLQNLIIREQPGTIVQITGTTDPAGKNDFRDWYVLLADRPEKPSQNAFDRDVQFRVLLPLFGMDLKPVGKRDRYSVESLITGSIADESGFSVQDSVELRKIEFNDEYGLVSVQLLAKRRKSGYMDAFIGLTASLDSPSYF